MFHLGIVGHRYLASPETVTFVADQCLAILKQTKVAHPDVVALSAIAEGADTLFAEAALALAIPLEIVRPFRDYVSDFKTATSRRRYKKLRAAARREVELVHQKRSDAAYEAAMNWIVTQSDVLVVVWDGLRAAGAGGTGDAVKEAALLNRTWLHLDVTNLSVTLHAAETTTKQRGAIDANSSQHSGNGK